MEFLLQTVYNILLLLFCPVRFHKDNYALELFKLDMSLYCSSIILASLARERVGQRGLVKSLSIQMSESTRACETLFIRSESKYYTVQD